MGWTGYRTRDRHEALSEHLADVSIVAGPVWRGQVSANTCDLHAWVLAKRPRDGTPGVLCCLVDTSKALRGEVMVKDIDESMGPLVVDCPEGWLLMAPCPEGPYAAAWRSRVRAFWQRRGGWGGRP